MLRKVEVVPYNPEWPGMFREEAERLAAIFGAEIIAIHHIGSTSVPGLSAKPIIDILPEVRDITAIDRFNDEMIRQGYLPRGEFGLPGRRYFSKGGDEQRRHHVHAYQPGNPELKRHLAFRDYLIAHPDEARAYADLKITLARQFPTDIEGYMDGKDAMIKDIERMALAWVDARRGGSR